MSASPTSPEIVAVGLATGYRPGAPNLSGVTFAAGGNQIIAVLGPNGGGKTTLLRAILNELPTHDGSLAVDGTIAYVPQTDEARLDFPVSAFDVALMGAYHRTEWFRRVSRSDRERASEALRRVGLADRAFDQFGTLSGGQRQRVLIARALVHDASILLLDEPFSGVDRTSEQTILRVLDEIRAEGRLLLLCTHDIGQARSFDQVLALNGEQTFFGPGSGLDADVLQRTYGDEIVTLDDGTVITVGHHHH